MPTSRPVPSATRTVHWCRTVLQMYYYCTVLYCTAPVYRTSSTGNGSTRRHYKPYEMASKLPKNESSERMAILIACWRSIVAKLFKDSVILAYSLFEDCIIHVVIVF